MKIKIAETAGFCMGVRRAVKLTLDESEKKNPVYTYGPLIHNPQVLNLFSKRGIIILNNIPDIGLGTVIIRAHGVPPTIKSNLIFSGFKVIDATCPRVSRVQKIIKINAQKGYTTIIVGDKNHPEVASLIGCAISGVYVVYDISELRILPIFDKAIVVAQTTQNINVYKIVQKWIIKKNLGYNIYDTICDSTEKRQIEVKLLASSVDLVIVVGGKQSGNTKRLKEVAASYCKKVLHIEDESELSDYRFIFSVKKIGITAGASTPNWVIKKVCSSIHKIFSN